MEKFEKNIEVIKKKLQELKLQGFDTVHLPGGTSKDGSYSCTVVIPYYDDEGKSVYFVGLPYNSKIKSSNGNKKVGENPIETIIREAMEETGLILRAEDLIEIIPPKEIPDNRPGFSGKIHTKYCYVATNFSGNLFSFEGGNPIDKETAAPMFFPAKFFLEVIFKGHESAVRETIKKLMGEAAKYAFALMNLV